MILISASSQDEDPCIPPVVSALEKRGARVSYVYADRFPTDLALSLSLGGGVRCAGELPLDEVRAVWFRSLDIGAELAATGMRDDHLAAARIESETAYWAILQGLAAFPLDPLPALRSAPDKAGQIILAESLGLRVPRSLISNEPDAVRALYAACPHGLVAKMLAGGAVGIGEQPVFTRAIGPDDLDRLDSLRLSPMLFQERICKDRELRVTAVGGELFVAAIDVPADAPVDFRTSARQIGSFQPATLPDPIGRALLAMLDRLDLNFATFDILLTPEGEHVFLELNTISYFDFVERGAGLPISEAVAELLLGLRPARPGTTGARLQPA